MLPRKLPAPATVLLMACQDFATSKKTKVLTSAIDAAPLNASRFMPVRPDNRLRIPQISRAGVPASVTQITLIVFLLNLNWSDPASLRLICEYCHSRLRGMPATVEAQ